jgi:hypothetical protein
MPIYHNKDEVMAKQDVFKRVIVDLKNRDNLGWTQHGRPLQPDTYDNPLQEAYEEALDLVVYLKCALLKQKRSEVENEQT